MSKQLFILAASAHAAIYVRKSRFVANAARVASADAALVWVAQIRDMTASHNCWAYRIGNAYRFSDDGEPAGTGGKPILQAIDAQSFDYTVIVVTRWFGGIKLGAGGLTRAYGGSAAQTLRAAPKNALIDQSTLEFTLELSLLPYARKHLDAYDGRILERSFAIDSATLRVSVPTEHVKQFCGCLSDLSRGRVTLHSDTAIPELRILSQQD